MSRIEKVCIDPYIVKEINEYLEIENTSSTIDKISNFFIDLRKQYNNKLAWCLGKDKCNNAREILVESFQKYRRKLRKKILQKFGKEPYMDIIFEMQECEIKDINTNKQCIDECINKIPEKVREIHTCSIECVLSALCSDSIGVVIGGRTSSHLDNGENCQVFKIRCNEILQIYLHSRIASNKEHIRIHTIYICVYS